MNINQAAWTKTTHFVERQNQRVISDGEVLLALRFGLRFHERGGDVVHFLGRRCLPKTLNDKAAKRANGIVVVVSPDQKLVTTYRNPHFIKALKKRGNEPRRGQSYSAPVMVSNTFQTNQRYA